MFRTIAILALTGLAAAAISVDGSCGGANNATCQGSEFGNCCSQYGYCGSTTPYCGQGCNSLCHGIRAVSYTHLTALPSAEAPSKSTGDARRSNRPVVVRRSL